ncbi:hypothetical protein LDENG_00070190, partial [Lucifuga dentata]
TCLLRSVSDLSDKCLRIFLNRGNSAVISCGGLPRPFVITKLTSVSFCLIMLQTAALSLRFDVASCFILVSQPHHGFLDFHLNFGPHVDKWNNRFQRLSKAWKKD